jgi:TatD DNase family protein
VFDAHIHLDELDESQLGTVLWEDPHYRAVIPGVTPERTVEAQARFGSDSRIHLAAALHPWWVMDLDAEATPETNTEFNAVRELAALSSTVAVGETGLDHIKCPPDHRRYEQQLHFFRAHAALSLSLNKPLIVHAVRCHAAVQQVLKPYLRAGLRVMIHAYAGSVEETRQYASLGCLMSIGPPVTREGSSRIRAAAREIPDSLLLIETDAPAMAAGVERGRGEGRVDDVTLVAACVAELRDVEPYELEAQTGRTASTFFSLN